VIALQETPRQDRADDHRWLGARVCDAAVTGNVGSKRLAQAAHEAIHQTPESASSWLPVMARRHCDGGARIEQSRKKIRSTTMACPQCAHTKVSSIYATIWSTT
jgi:hypothetical protein